MEKPCSFLMFIVTSKEANSPSLLQALSFYRKTLLDKAFEIREDGLLFPQPSSSYIQFITAQIDLGYNHAENAHKVAVMSRLWEERKPSVYDNRSVAPIVHIDTVPHELLMVKKYPFVPWFCPAFKIVLL